MLCSLKAAALGLNLTAANNVFLLDPWWQESIGAFLFDLLVPNMRSADCARASVLKLLIESQAIDRCNR